MNLTRLLSRRSSVAVGLLIVIPSLARAGNTVGVYDENIIQLNRVDRTALNSFITAPRFAGRVEEAFTRSFGGVADSNHFGTNYNLGPGTSRTLEFASSSTMFVGIPGLTATTISGASCFTFEQASLIAPNYIGLGSVIGGLPNERVVDFGFTILSPRDFSHPAISVSVRLDDNTSMTIAGNSIPQGVGTNDVFFGFSAPAGRYINLVQVGYTTTGGYTRVHIDDIGFKTAVVGTHLQTAPLLACGQATKSGSNYTVQSGAFNAQETAIGTDRRGVMEFSLPKPGFNVTVHEALLEFNCTTFTSGGTTPSLSVFGYTADGLLSPTDATGSTLQIGVRQIDKLGGFAIALDPAYVAQLMNSNQDLGLLLRSLVGEQQVGVSDLALGDNVAPTLTVRFSPVPEPLLGLLVFPVLCGLGRRRM